MILLSQYRPNRNYPINWNQRRQAVFKAVGYICQMCGKYAKGELHYHHIRPIGCGGSNSPRNCVPICCRCHKFIHSGHYQGPLLDLRKKR